MRVSSRPILIFLESDIQVTGFLACPPASGATAVNAARSSCSIPASRVLLQFCDSAGRFAQEQASGRNLPNMLNRQRRGHAGITGTIERARR